MLALRAHCESLMEQPEIEVEEIQIQHLLVSFAGAARSEATRSKDEAEALAADLYQRILSGEKFKPLVREFTDDSAPGIYTMTTGRPSRKKEVYPRKTMVPAFGDVGYRLEVGEIGVASYHKRTSPFGWHILKRLK